MNKKKVFLLLFVIVLFLLLCPYYYSERQDFVETLDQDNTETCYVALTTEEYGKKYGHSSRSPWLNEYETRSLYNKILPRCLLEQKGVPICKRYYICAWYDLAKIAHQSRNVAKYYARERGNLRVKLYSYWVDFSRSFSFDQPSPAKFWNYSIKKLLESKKDLTDEKRNDHSQKNLWSEQCESVCEHILESAFRTNEELNRLYGEKPQQKKK
ncbi:hypothetical protein RFI_08587 [Reticulomyxa filosa]|uniref:Uncharacterized protein n=1 Tax=Reticulomyxa filosa TaxID=46433 RepID=X6NRH7_RETFI|nr:hypothetical protein RFI_08587 [Reticulomyxa filosa]|eukprot:ETO28543.1 hypothetical protein RFI_08587 [Reticulomyxa filosa]